MKLGFPRLSGIIVFAMIISACSGSSEDKITGDWYEVGGTESIKFFADGTVSIIEDSVAMSGNFAILDEQNLRVELGGIGALAGLMVIGYEFSGNNLVITQLDGSVGLYAQSKEDASVELDRIKSQMQPGFAQAWDLIKAARKYFKNTRSEPRLPGSNVEAGLKPPSDYRSEFVESMAVENGTVVVTYGGNASPAINGKTLLFVLIPQTTGKSLNVQCEPGSMDQKYADLFPVCASKFRD